MRKLLDNRILLYHPRTFHEENYAFYWLPYSLLAASTYIHQRGYPIDILDANCLTHAQGSEYIQDTIKQSKIVGISAMIGRQILDGIEFANQVREANPDALIIWGGYAPSLLPHLFTENGLADFVVVGRGEQALLDIAGNTLFDNSLSTNKDTVAGDNPTIIYPSPGKFEEFDQRPSYPYSLVNVAQYVRNDAEVNSRTINYVSSQGCPFRCGFCSEVAIYKGKWLSLFSEKVVDDIRYLCETYQVNGIKFYDPNFFVNKKRVFRFVRLLGECNIRINWAAAAHPGNLAVFTDSDWKALKDSGCSRLLIGAESGCQSTLDQISKKTTLATIYRVAEQVSRYHIIGSFTFVVGFPDDPPDAIEATLCFAQDILSLSPNFEAKIHFYLPYPGTPLFARAIARGFRPPATLEEWGNYDYYRIETPWLHESSYEVIRRFNETHCPYVQKIVTENTNDSQH